MISTHTVGEEPSPPRPEAFLRVNSTLAILLLDQWQQPSCPILYFVIEYKLAIDLEWTTGATSLILDAVKAVSAVPPVLVKLRFSLVSPSPVTNNLQVQDVYSIRGLQPGTSYDLKVSISPSCSSISSFISESFSSTPTSR